METNNYPSLLDRIQSAFIDSLLILIVIIIVSSIFENYSNSVRVSTVIFFMFLYEPLFMTIGCTLGNYIKGIRVKKYTDTSKRINFLQAIIRYPIKLFLGWISFLTIHSNSQRRAIHDLVSGTVMIKIK